MKIRVSDIPNEKSFEDYSDDTIFVLNDRMPIWNCKNMKRIYPGEEGYEEAYRNRPKINPENDEILYPGDLGYDELV